MHDRKAYEDNVITEFANMFRQRRPGISDDQLGNEYLAAQIFYDSLKHFIADTERAAALSDLRRDQLKEMLEILSDAAPSMRGWEEDISLARQS